MADFLEETRAKIAERLKELKPLVDEYHQLEEAERALSGVRSSGGASSRSAAPRARRAPSSRASASSSSGSAAATGAKRRGRPKGSGTRAKQAEELVKARPGITIPELAETMGIKQNYLYRVLPSLREQGKVRKSGRGWHPAG